MSRHEWPTPPTDALSDCHLFLIFHASARSSPFSDAEARRPVPASTTPRKRSLRPLAGPSTNRFLSPRVRHLLLENYLREPGDTFSLFRRVSLPTNERNEFMPFLLKARVTADAEVFAASRIANVDDDLVFDDEYFWNYRSFEELDFVWIGIESIRYW